MNEKVKVGFCVAYDWHLLAHALPRIYSQADLICLSVDIDRITWSGNSFAFDDLRFKQLIESIDRENKIILVEEDYHIPTLTPMQNEVRQRNRIASHMKPGGWHIQLDCDEYFVDFEGFVKYLQALPNNKTSKANVCCPWVSLFKQVKGGFLYVDPETPENIEFMQIATREPAYEYGRRNGNFNLFTNFRLIHQSWARPPEEIKEKIYNWGHSQDFHKEDYFNFWNTLNDTTYSTARNFHWLTPNAWPSLKFVRVDSITELVSSSPVINFPSLTTTDRFFKNSRFFSRLRKVRDIFIKAVDHRSK